MSVATAHFNCTKLIVAELDKACAFYTSVFGLAEAARVEAAIEGRPIREIIFRPTAPGGAVFVLLTYPSSEAAPAHSEAITLFAVADLTASLGRAKAAGGRIVQGPDDMPEHGVKVAFIRDVEGHLIEVVQQIGTPAYLGEPEQ